MFKTKGGGGGGGGVRGVLNNVQNNCKIGTAGHPLGPSWVETRVKAYYPQNWQPLDGQVQQIYLFYKT